MDNDVKKLKFFARPQAPKSVQIQLLPTTPTAHSRATLNRNKREHDLLTSCSGTEQVRALQQSYKRLKTTTHATNTDLVDENARLRDSHKQKDEEIKRLIAQLTSQEAAFQTEFQVFHLFNTTLLNCFIFVTS